MTNLVGTCIQPGCKVAETGQCLEGLSLSGSNICPNFVPFSSNLAQDSGVEDTTDEEHSVVDDSEEDADSIGEQPIIKSPNTIMHPLHHGDELDLDEAVSVLRSFPTRLIVLAGDSNSGKTTILSCINECFQRGPYAGYIFARSRTLVALERLCYESRLTSGRTEPVTARTILHDGPRFIHLTVRREDLSASKQHILFSNIPGENFRHAKDTKEDALKLDFIRRADHFVMIVDGSLIAGAHTRTKARSHAQRTLRRLIETKMLGLQSQVDILISKWDCVQAVFDKTEDVTTDEKKALQDFLDDTENLFKEQFESQVASFRVCRVAARPHHSSDLPEGYGLDQVFPSWVENAAPILARDKNVSTQDNDSASVSSRESARYVWTAPSASH